MILKIGARASIEVSSFAEASLVYAAHRDGSFEGASTFPDGAIFDGNQMIARVSYNAKVWLPGSTEGQTPIFDPYVK
jgi:hypothetical protein